MKKVLIIVIIIATTSYLYILPAKLLRTIDTFYADSDEVDVFLVYSQANWNEDYSVSKTYLITGHILISPAEDGWESIYARRALAYKFTIVDYIRKWI